MIIHKFFATAVELEIKTPATLVTDTRACDPIGMDHSQPHMGLQPRRLSQSPFK